MASPCIGCEYLRSEKMGWSVLAPVVHYCNGHQTVLVQSGGKPVQHIQCDKQETRLGDEYRGCCA